MKGYTFVRKWGQKISTFLWRHLCMTPNQLKPFKGFHSFLTLKGRETLLSFINDVCQVRGEGLSLLWQYVVSKIQCTMECRKPDVRNPENVKNPYATRSRFWAVLSIWNPDDRIGQDFALPKWPKTGFTFLSSLVAMSCNLLVLS